MLVKYGLDCLRGLPTNEVVSKTARYQYPAATPLSAGNFIQSGGWKKGVVNLILVLIPVYNGGELVKRAVTSAFSAGADCVVVVDDGSEDETSDICLSLSHLELKYYRQKNQGEAAAVNEGVRRVIEIASRTEDQKLSNKASANSAENLPGFVCILSHDDTLVEGSLRVLKSVLDENLHASVAYGNFDIVDEKGLFKSSVTPPEYDEKELIGRLNCLPGVGSLIRLDAIVALGLQGYQLRNPGIRFISDLEQWFRLSTIGPFLKVNKKVGNWTDHPSQASKILNFQAKYKDLDFFLDLFDKDVILAHDSNLVNLAKSNLHRRAAIVHSSFGRKIDDRPFWLNSLRHMVKSLYFLLSSFDFSSRWRAKEFFGVLIPFSARAYRYAAENNVLPICRVLDRKSTRSD